MERRGLGKGLSALITEASLGESVVREIPLSQIRPNPYQPRQSIELEQLQELADSIRQVGVLQPVVVRQAGLDRYELIAGERRFRAAELAGLSTIPAILRDSDEQAMLQLALIENIQRQEINPVDTARAYKRLMDEFDLTQDEVAERVGKSRSSVANTVRLLKLPFEILQSLESGEITEGHARSLLALEDSHQQYGLWQRILRGKLSVRDTEMLAKESKSRKSRSQKNGDDGLNRAVLLDITALQEGLTRHLGTKVNILYLEREKGRIVIEFYGDEELNRLVELIAPQGL